MTLTSFEIRAEIARLNREIAMVERKPASEQPRLASQLAAAKYEREMHSLVLLGRRIEQQNKVVRFQRWCKGP